MPEGSLAVTAAVHLATAASFAAVAIAVARRSGNGAHQAGIAFAIWWGALAGYLALQGVLLAAASFSAPSLDAFLWSRLAAIPLLCAAAGGLTYYILYLLTGRSWLRAPVALLYLATAAAFHVATFVPSPTGLRVTPWTIELELASSPALKLAVYTAVGLPPILGSVALLWTSRRMERPQRYRARLVGTAILAYVGSGLAAFTAAGQALQMVALLGMGLVAAVLVLLAYFPPRRIAERAGLPAPATRPLRRDRHAQREARRQAFRQRGQELI